MATIVVVDRDPSGPGESRRAGASVRPGYLWATHGDQFLAIGPVRLRFEYRQARRREAAWGRRRELADPGHRTGLRDDRNPSEADAQMDDPEDRRRRHAAASTDHADYDDPTDHEHDARDFATSNGLGEVLAR
jgi:hypothetical protein